jgi:DNA gyrase subunit A
VAESDQIMLVTDGGQLIRCPVNDVRIAGRNTQGVTIFNTDKDERVVSVEHIPDEGDDDADIGDDDADIGDNDGEKPSTE